MPSISNQPRRITIVIKGLGGVYYLLPALDKGYPQEQTLNVDLDQLRVSSIKNLFHLECYIAGLQSHFQYFIFKGRSNAERQLPRMIPCTIPSYDEAPQRISPSTYPYLTQKPEVHKLNSQMPNNIPESNLSTSSKSKTASQSGLCL